MYNIERLYSLPTQFKRYRAYICDRMNETPRHLFMKTRKGTASVLLFNNSRRHSDHCLNLFTLWIRYPGIQ